MKWSFIILCKVADVPQELERRMTEVRTVVSSAHVTDRERAVGQLEREVKHAFDNADALSGSVAAAVAAGDDERDYHLKQGAYGPGGEYYEGGDGAVSADDLRKQQDLRKLRGALG